MGEGGRWVSLSIVRCKGMSDKIANTKPSSYIMDFLFERVGVGVGGGGVLTKKEKQQLRNILFQRFDILGLFGILLVRSFLPSNLVLRLFIDADTQPASFRGNPLCQAPKRH